MKLQGGYRISNKLKEDLFDIKTLAEINRSIAETAEGLGKEDKNGLKSNSEKIKRIVDNWTGFDTKWNVKIRSVNIVDKLLLTGNMQNIEGATNVV